MNSIDYIEVTAIVTPPQPWTDLLIVELAEIGFESFEENLKGFKAFIPSKDFNAAKLDNINIPEAESGEVSFLFSHKIINSRNWNSEWESNFEPVDVAGKCYIRAPFHDPKQGYDFEIIIEPKMSFGTGHHATTTLVVEWMLEMDFAGKKVLDMGCGTGILAILAAMKGAKEIKAIDNYPYAYENTLENIKKNDVSHIKALLGDASLLGTEKFDILLANITKNVLKEDMAVYAQSLLENGSILISGFFEEDMNEMVIMAEGFGLKQQGYKKKKEWVAVRLRKSK